MMPEPETGENRDNSIEVEFLTAMALNFPGGLLIADRNDRVVFANTPAVDFLGKHFTEVLGLDIQAALEDFLLHAREPKGLYSFLINNRPDHPAQYTVKIVSPEAKTDGSKSETSVRVTVFTVKDTEGRWLGRTILFQNVPTEQNSDQIKNEFVAIVSHELRTPLSAIQGFSELLLTQEVSPERQKLWLEMINRESVRLTGLIDDMLSLSRIESGRIDLKVERVEPDSIIRQCVEILKIGTSLHTFHFELEENLPAVRADRDKLIQVFNNIIGNAIKYSGKGGQIVIRAGYSPTQPQFIQISVTDQGIGIPESELPQIFDKFYRVRNGQTRNVKGTGLGLAITKNLVELMGGSVWVESILGQGSTFYFTLPVHIFPQREINSFKAILLKTLLSNDKDSTEADLYLDYLQRTLPNSQLDEVLKETLYEIGDLWEAGKIGVGDEHLASGIVRDFISRTKLGVVPPNGYRLVIGSVAGEEHVLGLMMVANAFTGAGWHVINLGANVPLAAFLTTLKQSKPDLLMLSVALSPRLVEVKRVIQEVRNTFTEIMIGVGGRLLAELPDIAEMLGADFRGTTPEETVSIALNLLKERGNVKTNT